MLIFLQKNNVGSDTVVCHPNIYYRAQKRMAPTINMIGAKEDS